MKNFRGLLAIFTVFFPFAGVVAEEPSEAKQIEIKVLTQQFSTY
jgi:hypothetical protein